jgi:hypothetical protein
MKKFYLAPLSFQLWEWGEMWLRETAYSIGGELATDRREINEFEK